MKTPNIPQDNSQGELKEKQGRTSGPVRKSTKRQWTPEEDKILCQAVERYEGKKWKKIAECFENRTDVQCLHRWQKVLNPELVKGPWSTEEDNTIIALVEKYGAKNWSTISQHLPGRIGKQCRERWHNHLNPEINKNPWTQEEEVTLIRAHQIYGNKWAELMKFLPGRSDNSIKNHWNSSVKKKLDSYYASGLLDQFQSLPLTALQNKSGVSSSSLMHNSGDEGSSGPGVDAKESERSHTSTDFSQSTNNLQVEVKPGNEEIYMPEFHSATEQQIANAASHAELPLPSFEDVETVAPEISCEAECSMKFQNLNCSHEVRTTAAMEDQMQGVSIDAKEDLDLDLLTHNMDSDVKNQALPQDFQSSVKLSDQRSLPNSDTDPEAQTMITDEECCRVLFADTMKNSSTSSGEQSRNMVDPKKGKEFLCSQSAETHADETGKFLALPWHPSSSEGLAGHNCVPLLDSDLKDSLLLRNNPSTSVQGCDFYGATELERKTDTIDEFIDYDGHETSHGNDDNDSIPEQQVLPSIPEDSLKLLPLDSFSSPSRVSKIFVTMDDKPEEKDKGGLCYEPPRFPSADIPFFTCDLVSADNLRQDYSPFGIRQLMMSSMNCTTPLRLWDSTCQDTRTDAMRKDRTKSFVGAQSILKKRHLDFLSPVLDRRKDKKLIRAATSTLAKDLSLVDGMLDEGDDCRPSHPVQYPENKNRCASLSEAKDKRNSASGRSDHEMIPIDEEPKETLKSSGVTSMQNEKGCNDSGASAKNDQERLGSFVDMGLCSPGMTGSKPDNKVNTSAKDPSNLNNRSLGEIPAEEISLESPFTVDSTPLSTINKSNIADTSYDIENNIFDGTPFRQLLNTPSPWRSPLLFDSFIQSQKFPSELTYEDNGCFMTPGKRSYDAIGLMKHLSEHSAGAYADALQVLGNDTPESLLKKRRLNKSIQGKENQHQPYQSQVERRTLDFSNCGTPGKAKAPGASSSPGDDSRSSSYLVKNCR